MVETGSDSERTRRVTRDLLRRRKQKFVRNHLRIQVRIRKRPFVYPKAARSRNICLQSEWRVDELQTAFLYIIVDESNSFERAHDEKGET